MTKFILVTTTPNVRILIEIDMITCIREPIKADVLEEGTRTVVMTRSGVNVFCLETMDYFFEVLGDKILRRLDS